MSLLKQLSLAAVFAASLFFVSDALADEKEKNPFTKEINAVKRAEKRLQKAKNNAARKRAETNLKKEKKALENAVKEETARYEKALKAVEEQLKLKNENEENKEKNAALIEKLEARQSALKEKIEKLKAFGDIDSAGDGKEDEKADKK